MFVQATNQPKFQVFAETETEFVKRQVRAGFKFTKNEKGEITGVTSLQGRRQIPAQKIK